jgi:hypothetical protein
MTRKFYSTALLALALFASSAVFAGPTLSWSQTYYSDASMTVAVGEKYVDCNGNIYNSGVVSMYRGPKVLVKICQDSGN